MYERYAPTCIREVSSFQKVLHVYTYVCTGFNGGRCVPIREVSSFWKVLCVRVQELGPEDVSLFQRCPHFRGCYIHE